MYWRIYFLAELSLKSEIRNPKLSPLSAASISISGHFAASEFMLLVDNCEFCVCLFKALCLLSLLTMWL
ncbi:unnamed protein product, partial [Brassica oleracea]